LRRFSCEILNRCRKERPTHLLVIGLVPPRAGELRAIRALGIITMVFLTDDPWIPWRKSRWFMRALLEYDAVFSTRWQNLDDLRRLGCRAVHYLQFAYAPEEHFPQPAEAPGEEANAVLFVGGADDDRAPFIRALVAGGLKVALYGGRLPRIQVHLARPGRYGAATPHHPDIRRRLVSCAAH
jgi:hypothetical protein